ncbi:IniB N-terminal domain-containing protein [Sporichthya polymorpha]|uniref:IniB N-terminal domain-containing protein n=1 Tax=Sporichthya polymorpha TaxID=35751 RepID=UPI0003656CE1|nr:IniB N-terminal domain-containing protein [Sporichthya polymorpha]
MATSLLDWIMDLMRDGGAREAFNTNPQLSMASAGFTNVCGADVADSRAFLFDNPSIREVGGVDRPATDDADAAEQIRYIINNYTIEQPAAAGSNVTGPTTIVDTPGPNDVDDQDTVVDGDGNTVSSNQANTTDQTSSDDDTVEDSSTNTDSDADNVVNGDNSAGENQIAGGIDDLGEGLSGDDNTNIITLADVVDIEESPILNESLNRLVDDSLNEVAYNALQDADNLISILG